MKKLMYEADTNKLTHEIWKNPGKWYLLRESNELLSNVSFDPALDIHYKVLNRYDDMLHDSNIIRFYLHERLDLSRWEPEYFYMKLTTIPISKCRYFEGHVFEFDRAKRIMHFYKTEKEVEDSIRWVVKKEVAPESLNNPKSEPYSGIVKKITSYIRRAIGGEFRAQEKESIIREKYIPIHDEVKTSRNIELLNLSDNSLVSWNSIFGNPYFAFNGCRRMIENIKLDIITRNYLINSLEFAKGDVPSLEKIRNNLGF